MLERIFPEPKFRLCCLGGLKLVEAHTGTDMTPTSRKTRALIGYLCIVGKPVGRERLASLLWGDRGDEQARASLRQAIYELRSLPGGDRLLKVERDTIAVGEDVATDVAAITAAARSGDLEQLSHALSEWRGDFFEDLPSIDPSFDTWLQSERHRVQERLVEAAAEAVQAGLARGEIEPARKIVNLLQHRDGTNEVVLRHGLRLDHRAGDSASLRRRYERFRELLKSELDATPAAETQRLYQELTAGSLPLSRSGPNADVTGAAREDLPGDRQNGAANRPRPVPRESTAGDGAEKRILRPPLHIGHRMRVAAIALGIVILGALAWVVWSSLHKAVPLQQEPLLAVLPFQNLSADPASRCLSQGINEEVAEALRQRTPIRVAPTPPDLRLRNASAPRTLAATHVLSGSVERVGDRVRVIAQLMNVQDDSVVWSRAYDAAAKQMPALRHTIAGQIAGALGKLLASGRFGEAQHPNPAAYDHYLKGRHLLLQRYPGAAATELEASVRLAPNFANAWSALAIARWSLAGDALTQDNGHNESAMARAARAAAQRALKLDPKNGEALGLLALLIPSTHLQEIDRQFGHALRSEPENAQVLGWHGAFLMFVGRNHEALSELTRAYVLEPATPSVAPNLVLASLKTGRFEEGREIIDLIDRGGDDRLRTQSYYLRTKYFLYQRDWFGLATHLSALPGNLSPRMAAFLRLCRATAVAFATRDSDRLGPLRVKWRSETSVDPDDAVQFLAALGDVDGALNALQSAVRSRQNDDVLTDPEWEALFVPNLRALRRDPRVPALFAQWGLTDYWRAANHVPDFMR